MDNITEMLGKIRREMTAVHQEIKKMIENEGLSNEQINDWINSLNEIIRLTDHTTEVLEESK